MKKEGGSKRPTLENIENYRMLMPMLTSIFEELKELSKKKQDGLLNETKVKMTNRILSKIKEILVHDPAIEFLDLLDEEKLPSNSDAVLQVAQFKSALEQFKVKHYSQRDHTWITSDSDD